MSSRALRPLITNEALARQGKTIDCALNGRTIQLAVDGGPDAAEFERGGEGLVHRVTEIRTGTRLRLKCFWAPSLRRRTRSEVLVKQQLSRPDKLVADALGGAPLAVVGLDGVTEFAVLMKNIGGMSWKAWIDRAEQGIGIYPPSWWPSLDIRLTWAYGLALAVSEMEQRDFIHADVSPGNVMVTAQGEHSGDMALIDFDGFVCPKQHVSETELRGTEGFAPPEVWNRQRLEKGTDRVGMALMIQQFLLAGHPAMRPDDAFRLQYKQAEDICERKATPHPVFRQQFGKLSELLHSTLAVELVADRPVPQAWCSEVLTLYRALVGGPAPKMKSTGEPSQVLLSVVLEDDAAKAHVAVPIADTPTTVDLTPSFGIRADLVRLHDLRLILRVKQGAALHVKDAAGLWHFIESGTQFQAADNIVISDPEAGKINIRVRGKWDDHGMSASA